MSASDTEVGVYRNVVFDSPTFPASGFFHRCCPVIITEGSRAGQRGVIIQADGSGCDVAIGEPPNVQIDGYRHEHLAFDLSDQTGRSHLREKLVRAYSHGATELGLRGWALLPSGSICYVEGEDVFALDAWRHDDPLLADLDPRDPRIILDGTLWVCTEALVRIAKKVLQ